jgi:hypothetical protein
VHLLDTLLSERGEAAVEFLPGFVRVALDRGFLGLAERFAEDDAHLKCDY